MIIYSVNCADIVDPTFDQNWYNIDSTITSAAQSLQKAGADFIVIACNTVHKVADEVQSKIEIPILNIVDSAAFEIKRRGWQSVGLLGTKETMEDGFYQSRLFNQHGISTLVPDYNERNAINHIILDELFFSTITKSSRNQLMDIAGNLVLRGANGVLLACTELGLLIGVGNHAVPFIDTTEIHCHATVDYALK
jgi:aspartate racemase